MSVKQGHIVSSQWKQKDLTCYHIFCFYAHIYYVVSKPASMLCTCYHIIPCFSVEGHIIYNFFNYLFFNEQMIVRFKLCLLSFYVIIHTSCHYSQKMSEHNVLFNKGRLKQRAKKLQLESLISHWQTDTEYAICKKAMNKQMFYHPIIWLFLLNETITDISC